MYTHEISQLTCWTHHSVANSHLPPPYILIIIEYLLTVLTFHIHTFSSLQFTMGSYTKSYLLSLFLLFLLVLTSAQKPMTKIEELIESKYFKYLQKFKEKVLDDNRPDKIMSLIPPPPPPALSQKFKVPIWIKEHLSIYGYLPDSDNFTDVLDSQAKSAIEEYQQFFNLKVTGFPDKGTSLHMSLLRCGVPDKNFTYDLSTANVSWPLGTQWFPNGRKNLTYGFAPYNEVPENVTKVFEDSFKRWSDAITVLNLTETKMFEDADIKIVFIPMEGKRDDDITSFGQEVVGATVIGLSSDNSSPTNDNGTFGAMILDDSRYFLLPSYNNVSNILRLYGRVVDMETVVMHQIGHLLGLEHSSHEDSVMYPAILPYRQRKVKLSEDDKEQIKQVYSPPPAAAGISGSSGVTKLVWGLVTSTLSLGLAIMVLFY